MTCSHFALQITLAGNTSNFEEFTFLARRTSWVKFTVKKVLGSSGGIGIQEIELNNNLCKQSKLQGKINESNRGIKSNK